MEEETALEILPKQVMCTKNLSVVIMWSITMKNVIVENHRNAPIPAVMLLPANSHLAHSVLKDCAANTASLKWQEQSAEPNKMCVIFLSTAMGALPTAQMMFTS